MSEGTVFRRLHGSAIRVQVPLVLSAIPIAACLYGTAAAPVVVDVALEGATDDAHSAARQAMWIVVGMIVACVAVVTAGAALLLRGSVRTIVGQMHDATAAIARGDFSHRIAGTRSDELGRLAESIDTMAERLERLEESRRRLLACVSHELRTPLTIIRGHAFTMARQEPDVNRRGRLQLIEAESARLGDLIEDLVDASSLHAGSVRLRVERCELRALAATTIARFEEAAALRGLRIELRCARHAIEVDADPTRIGQVLANLLANAVRHADPGSTVVVAVTAGRGGSSRRFVSVSNRGPRIPSDIAERIFEPFVQGGDRAGRVGLGLAIAHGLAAAHGGTLTLESRGVLSGLVEFRLALPPADRAQAGPSRARVERPARPPRLRVVES